MRHYSSPLRELHSRNTSADYGTFSKFTVMKPFFGSFTVWLGHIQAILIVNVAALGFFVLIEVYTFGVGLRRSHGLVLLLAVDFNLHVFLGIAVSSVTTPTNP